MKESQNLEPEFRSRISKLKWQEPGLIDLTRARQRARGDCYGTGSGDSELCIMHGLSAGWDCFAMGHGVL